MEGQISLFGPGSCSGRTSPGPSPATKAATSKPSSRSASESRSRPRLTCLRLTRAAGQKPGFSWETDGALLGAYSTRNIGECPSVGVESFLYAILEENVPEKYYLSAKACRGILRRAEGRGNQIPEPLRSALVRQSREPCPPATTEVPAWTEGRTS